MLDPIHPPLPPGEVWAVVSTGDANSRVMGQSSPSWPSPFLDELLSHLLQSHLPGKIPAEMCFLSTPCALTLLGGHPGHQTESGRFPALISPFPASPGTDSVVCCSRHSEDVAGSSSGVHVPQDGIWAMLL